jgi:transposase
VFDARLLAEYADRYADKITLATAPNLPVERLRQLFGERRRLMKMRTSTLNRRSQTDHLLDCPELLLEGWARQLEMYDRQITAIEERMEELVAAHEGLSEYYQLLCSIPGVGPVTGWLWLILFYGQQTLNFKKIASRFGFAPHSVSSGTSVQGRTRSSGHGQSQMRSCMPMVARVASTHVDRLSAYKQRKQDEGKPWPVIRNNLINKMIKIMCAIWNSQQPWDPDHVSQYKQQHMAA